jgi:hypothetical protein
LAVRSLPEKKWVFFSLCIGKQSVLSNGTKQDYRVKLKKKKGPHTWSIAGFDSVGRRLEAGNA